MLSACKSTKQINSFIDVAILKPRDLFRRYGARDSQGLYLNTSDSIEVPSLQQSTVIGQLSHAESMIKKQLEAKEV